MVQSIDEVLKERGERYGVFMGQARVAQSIHIVLDQAMQMTGKTRFDFAPDQLEAINMIVNKIGRIYNGDPHYSDSWRDIAGYATLVADRLDNDTEEQKRLARMKEQYERNRIPEQIKSNNQLTGQSESPKPPVELEVQDGEHKSTTETEPGVPGTPRQ